ncbi:MAG: hypothetical protein GYA41_04500 [Bacteroidales bacterium]|nr:hypothetical protein [Bacteroidales bacterium]
MKKTFILIVLILLTGTSAVTYAQKDRALKNGFSINLVAGLPACTYGLESATDIPDDLKLGPILGLQIGSRWYFSPGERFGAGLMVNWFDFTGAFKSSSSLGYELNRLVADITVLEVGPVFTFKFIDNLALDGYYNLRPTGLAALYTSSLGDESDEEGYAGIGVSHAIGAAFRWNVLSVGAEYVLGGIKCSNIDSEEFDPAEKLMVNSVRFMLGVKF